MQLISLILSRQLFLMFWCWVLLALGRFFSEGFQTTFVTRYSTKLLYQNPNWSGGSSYLESLDYRSPPITEFDQDQQDDDEAFLRFISQTTNQLSDNIQLLSETKRDPPPLSEEDRFLQMLSTEVQVKKLLNQNPYSLPDIRFDVLYQRFLDNLEDATQKNNGKVKGQSKLRRQWEPQEERPTVVVLGTGWAAHGFVKLASTYDLRIVVVSPVNHFVRFSNSKKI